MEIETFKRIVSSFADSPNDVEYSKGILTAQIRDEIFEVSFRTNKGDLVCVEQGHTLPAGQWIVQRLGRFDNLARRIIDYYPQDKLLIPVHGQIVDVLDSSPSAEKKPTNDVLGALSEFVDKLPAGMTNVVYLTSDAGAGKTSLIEALSQFQAQKYLAKKTEWLLLPVALGGRPFMSLDDVVIGGLANRLRFPFYYYGSVIELVKLGSLVLALDGFEELFVETQAGDAVSSLGNLVSRLESKGILVIAARKAYYQYKDVKAQARLFQSIRRTDVAFAEVSLDSWTREQFLALCLKAGIAGKSDAENLYETIASRLKQDHPLLTRAVLARRLLKAYQDTPDPSSLVQRLANATGEQYFEEFVSTLLEREVNEKWIDRSGDLARPLLSIDEHHALLMSIAEEMWRVGVGTISSDVLELIVELVVADQLRKPPEIVQQVKERIKQHALLRGVEGTRLYQFDHEDFRSFYLGRRIAALFQGKRNLSEIRSLLEIGFLPELSSRVAVARVISDTPSIAALVEDLCKIAETGTRISYIRGNCGRLVIQLVSICKVEEPIRLHHLYFSIDALKNVCLINKTFEASEFERTSLAGSDFEDVEFRGCEIVHFELPRHKVGSYGIKMDKISIPHGISIVESVDGDDPQERQYYDPIQIQQSLQFFGIETQGESSSPVHTLDELVEESEEIRLAERAMRNFRRSTVVSENVYRAKLGKSASRFFAGVLPELLAHGILKEEPNRGSGQNRQFRLEVGFDKIEQARVRSEGQFGQFLAILARTADDM